VLDLARDGLLYLDTSALMKLVVDEDETTALRELAKWGEGRFVTSALTRVELPRAVPPVVLGDRLEAVAELFDAMHVIQLTDAIIAAAAVAPPPLLRSLDAIHLASAQAAKLGGRAAIVCGYDGRLQQAAADHGLLAISPR
jgi:predicted nucleic acid-binding protein